jgi:hypothetical protein
MSWRVKGGTMMTTEAAPLALDYQGNCVTCRGCAHRDRLAAGACEPLRACVHDRYARRIDRFFSRNPDLADSYLEHPYFEVRAIAVRFASIFRLPALLHDVDETVRWRALLRLPPRYAQSLREDASREVRIRVAQRLAPAFLVSMMDDADYYVRLEVARRLPPQYLAAMARDAEVLVRAEVMQRIGEEWLASLRNDPDPSVRVVIARRLQPEQLPLMLRDEDWRVRHEVAQRIGVAHLKELSGDEDPLVREVALQRLVEYTGGERWRSLCYGNFRSQTMVDIARDSDEVELDGPPMFDYGQKVRSRKNIRNDGTFPGKEIGEVLVKKGEEGYVTSIGTFLQRFYIYGVDFVDRGCRVGMRSKELELVVEQEGSAHV